MVKSIKKRIIVGFFIALNLILCVNVHAKEIVVSPENGVSSGYALSITNNSIPIAVNQTFNFGGLYFYGASASGSWKTLGAFYNIPSTGCYNVSITASFSGSTSFAPNSYSAFLRLTDDESSIPFSNDGISSQYLPSGGSFNNGGIYSAHKDSLCLSKGRYGFLWYMNGMSFYDNQYYGFGNMILTPVPTNDFVTEQKNTTNAINKTNDTLKDQSDANTSGFLQDINQDYSNNPVSDLITMPITFLQTLNNNVSGSCITWNLGSLLGSNVTMPCINLQEIIGSNLYNLIDMAICLFLAYNIGLMCVTIWNNMTSLKDDFDDMYSPKHVYQGKHSGGDS